MTREGRALSIATVGTACSRAEVLRLIARRVFKIEALAAAD